MRPKGRLTTRQIDALIPAATRQYVAWDHTLPGFGVRVSPGGAKTYIVKYRLRSGRVRWKTLGRVAVLTLDEARKRARRDLGLVADDQDPLGVKDASRRGLRFADVADRFLAEHVAARRKPTTARGYRQMINGYLRPRFGSLPIGDVTTADVVRLHHRLRGTPYLANRTVAVLSKLMTWAVQAQLRAPGPNPCHGVEKYRETSRRRYLSPAELARLGCALRVGARRGALSPSVCAVIRLLLLTGARVGEILSLRWRDVDLVGAAIQLAESKTGRKTILLSAPAIETLKTWPRFAASPFVFPGERRGKRKGAHRVSLTDAWAWLRRRAKIADVRLHDLRHSYASIAVSNGQSLPMIGALLGHTQAATTARYAHLMDHPLRAASDATAATIAGAIGRRPR